MRSVNWPYRRISQWLLDEKKVKVSYVAVRNFCETRGIVKGGAEIGDVDGQRSSSGLIAEQADSGGRRRQLERRKAAQQRTARKNVEKKFTFDDSRPLRTRKNRQTLGETARRIGDQD